MACMELAAIFPQRRNRNLILILFTFGFLLLSILNPSQFMAQGRQFPHPKLMKNEEFVVKMRGLIGSRPPRCDQKCRNCGHCEAVQVPITPSNNIKILHQQILRIAYSRGDDLSNYKPMCWKCKCGDFFLNP